MPLIAMALANRSFAGGAERLRVKVKFPPLSKNGVGTPSKAIEYVAPWTAVKTTRALPSGNPLPLNGAKLNATLVSEARVLPPYTARIGLANSELAVASMTTPPDAGAVQEYHSELLHETPACSGSPGSRVANRLFATELVTPLPIRIWRHSKLSGKPGGQIDESESAR